MDMTEKLKIMTELNNTLFVLKEVTTGAGQITCAWQGFTKAISLQQKDRESCRSIAVFRQK